jgi:hypothetical protein
MPRKLLIYIWLIVGMTTLTVWSAWCLPPIPQPHPTVRFVETTTDHFTLWAKPISCTYSVDAKWIYSRYDCGVSATVTVTYAMTQGVNYTVRWEDIGLQPPKPGYWANVVWSCTMHYPDWEHGPVKFVTIDVDRVKAGPTETSANARLHEHLSSGPTQ